MKDQGWRWGEKTGLDNGRTFNEYSGTIAPPDEGADSNGLGDAMALVQLNSCFGGMRGKIGEGPEGIVLYTVGGRMIARSRGAVRDPKTSLQRIHRGVWSAMAKRYSELSSIRIEEWNQLASAIQGDGRAPHSKPYKGGQAYQTVNMHRCLAGLEPTDEAPEYNYTPAPTEIALILTSTNCAPAPEASDDGKIASPTAALLTLQLRHILSTGAGIWRVRLTQSLGRGCRRAQRCELRLASMAPSKAYIPIQGSPQIVELSPRYPYEAGEHCGAEIAALSSGFIPGAVLYLPHVLIEEGSSS